MAIDEFRADAEFIAHTRVAARWLRVVAEKLTDSDFVPPAPEDLDGATFTAQSLGELADGWERLNVIDRIVTDLFIGSANAAKSLVGMHQSDLEKLCAAQAAVLYDRGYRPSVKPLDVVLVGTGGGDG